MLTRGPWHPEHQHAGPPIALVCRDPCMPRRRTGSRTWAHHHNPLRPVPIAELTVEVMTDYAGRNAVHLSAHPGRAADVGRFTASSCSASQIAAARPPGHLLPAMLPLPPRCSAARFRSRAAMSAT